jgi:hypothetical protein
MSRIFIRLLTLLLFAGFLAAEEIPASTPVGRLGSPMTMQPEANTPATIDGMMV